MIPQLVRILLKFLFVSLLLALAAALGTEVVALHRRSRPVPNPAALPVVVRKSSALPLAPRSVRSVRRREG